MCTTMPNHYDYSKLMNMFKFTTRGILSGRKYSQLNTFSMPNTKTLRRRHIYKVISKLNLRLQNLLKKNAAFKILPWTGDSDNECPISL